MAASSAITREGFTAADLADCAEREVRQRQRAYPRWVEAGRMTQQLADCQTALRQAIARKLCAEAEAEGAKGDLCGGAAVRRRGDRECCYCLSGVDTSERELAHPTR